MHFTNRVPGPRSGAETPALRRGWGFGRLFPALVLTPVALRAGETDAAIKGITATSEWPWVATGMMMLASGWIVARTRQASQRLAAKLKETVEEENRERLRAEVRLCEAKALHQSLMENLPAGIYRKDKAGRFSFVNTLFCRMHAREEKEILDKTIFDLLPPEIAATAAAEDETVLRTGKLLELDKEDPRETARFRHIHIQKTPVFDAAGTLVGTQGMLSDITLRKATETQLDSERGLLRFLLDNSPDCVYFKDLQSRFIKVSQRHTEFFGMKHSHEMVGKSDFDFFDREHANPAYQDEQEIIRTGTPLVGKIEKEVAKDGGITWALTSKMPLRNQAGEIIGTFGISKDITTMKEAEAQLDLAHRQLLETSRMAGMAEVATSVLHNVGNVLNSVNVSGSVISDRLRRSKAANLGKAVALLRQHEKDLNKFLTEDAKGKQLLGYLESLAVHFTTEQEEMAKELGLLVKNIDHIKEIVAMQQSYSRVAGICETLPPADLVEDALRMNGASLDRHGVTLTREYANTPPIQVDKHKILQILVNLLRNAKHACDDSKRTDKRLIVRIALKGADRVSISIIDNGVGIPPENLTRIFNHGFTTRSEGHGFGLHSGALAAKEMGGVLTVQSDGPGLGAAFTLELPLQLSQAGGAKPPAPPSNITVLPPPVRNDRNAAMAG